LDRPPSERRQLIIAFEHGGALPWWGAFLLAAEKWGCPPWEIVKDGGSKMQWFYRFNEFERLRQKAQNG